MIKIASILAEKDRLQNYLYSGTRDQIDLHPNPYTVVGSSKGTIEGKGPLTPSERPENVYTSNKYNVGYPWNLQDPNIFEEESEINVHERLLPRELQVMEQLRKIAIRLRQTNVTDSDINNYIQNYIK